MFANLNIKKMKSAKKKSRKTAARRTFLHTVAQCGKLLLLLLLPQLKLHSKLSFLFECAA